MNQLKLILYTILIGVVGISSCENGDKDDYCDQTGGVEVKNQEGKIYKRRDFYYIGSVNEVTQGIQGGSIPCSRMPESFQKIGMRVVFSGIRKEGPSDHDDPLFDYIILTDIKENQN